MSQSSGLGALGSVSLLGGWFVFAVQLATILALAVAAGWRDLRWHTVLLPLAAAGAVLATVVMATLAASSADLAGDPIPFDVWFWVSCVLCGLAVLVLGWRSARWWRRGAGAGAVLLSLLCVGLALNQWVGYLPTLSSAWANLTNAPVAHQVTLSRVQAMHTMPKAGRIVPVDIPATYSHFPHRTELVYLPPIWFHGPKHPSLPVLEMIGAQFHKPADWVRVGGAARTADAYAARHHGYAPILVFADADGSFRKDTECVNGIRGNSATHLAEDIPSYVETTFNASPDPQAWGVVGWSMGGTCAVDLAVTHPERFDTFEDISGDLGPNMGDRQQTIETLYGGDIAAWAATDPMTVLAQHPHYPCTAGWFEDSTHDGKHLRAARYAEQLSRAGQRDGIVSTVHVKPGKHTWQFGAEGFADAFAWLTGRVAQPTLVDGQQCVAPHHEQQPVATSWHPVAG